VTACPGCFWAFKHSYARKGLKPPFEVLHISELLAELIDDGRLKFGHPGRVPKGIIYHDPCLLGRMGGVLEPPRKVLENIPGAGKVLEFNENRQDSACCGGGGTLRAIEEGMCVDIAARRVREAIELGAKTLVSSCPACDINLGDGIRAAREGAAAPDIHMRDLVELVFRAL
jgi:heterodisulfide reductase subunit D